MIDARHNCFPFVALVAAAALAGCAGSGSPGGTLTPAGTLSPTAGRHGWLSPAARRKSLIYVSDYNANAIVIYPKGQSNPSPIGEITDGVSGPLGNFVDAGGTLYVANSLSNTVTEYPHGSTSPSVTLSDGISGPISVAVDSQGNVAVGEFASQMILEFPAGSTSATVTITLLTFPEGLTFDRARHLYAAWNQDGSGLVGRVSKCRRMQAVCIDRGIAEGQSGGIAIDGGGNLILGDQTNQVVNVYAPGATSPMRSISTTGHAPYKFALDKSEKTLYVADILGGVVVTYDYATGSQTGTISSGLTSVWGVSLYPAAKPGP